MNWLGVPWDYSGLIYFLNSWVLAENNEILLFLARTRNCLVRSALQLRRQPFDHPRLRLRVDGVGYLAEAERLGWWVVNEPLRVARHKRLPIPHRPQVLRSAAVLTIAQKPFQCPKLGKARPLQAHLKMTQLICWSGPGPEIIQFKLHASNSKRTVL